MNRIILIGNGFDLAHELKTSYKDFIDDFWEKQSIDYNNNATSIEGMKAFNKKNIFFEFAEMPSVPITKDFYKTKKINFKNNFLEIITKEKDKKNWVDIEEQYNKHLQEIANGSKEARKYWRIDWLNRDFERIKNALENYLNEIIIANANNKYNAIILNKIYSCFKLKDFTAKGLEDIIEKEYEKFISIIDKEKLSIDDLSEKTLQFLNHAKALMSINSSFIAKNLRDIFIFKQFILENSNEDSFFYLFPKELMFLNFNYTNTERTYNGDDFFKNKTEGFKKEFDISKDSIHIHGELNNPGNPIIFGYGDEIADEYNVIEKKNDNRFLENIKSIKYLETDNYKKILNFANSDNYQIFIMGHSCGLSDRTLLNKLFEHENCVSIKVFYHKKEDGTDNYSDVVKNIS
jgi:hypothetical protein